MAEVAVHIEKNTANGTRFQATAGNRQTVGRTMGEALDALTADWGDTFEATEVLIEPLSVEEDFIEPHLVEVNGVWVIAGGAKMSPEEAGRDFVAEMYQEREQSFYAPSLKQENENPS